jgi:hypothetical protein
LGGQSPQSPPPLSSIILTRDASFLVRQDKERQIKAVLVATKTDLPSQRHAVSLQAAQDWATANGMDFCATSAVSDTEGEGPFCHVPCSEDREDP